jgi:hypothetical protein
VLPFSVAYRDKKLSVFVRFRAPLLLLPVCVISYPLTSGRLQDLLR